MRELTQFKVETETIQSVIFQAGKMKMEECNNDVNNH